MTVQDIKSLVNEYADLIALNLRKESDPKRIKEYADKLRLSNKIAEAVDSGALTLN